MDSRRLEDKLDKITDKISNIDVTLAEQAKDLKEHMRRTDLLEKKIMPIEKHVIMVNGVLKFFGVLAVFASIIEVVLKFLGV